MKRILPALIAGLAACLMMVWVASHEWRQEAPAAPPAETVASDPPKIGLAEGTLEVGSFPTTGPVDARTKGQVPDLTTIPDVGKTDITNVTDDFNTVVDTTVNPYAQDSSQKFGISGGQEDAPDSHLTMSSGGKGLAGAMGIGSGSGGHAAKGQAFGGTVVRRNAQRAANRVVESESTRRSSPDFESPQKLTSPASPPRVGKILYEDAGGSLKAMEPVAMRVVVFLDGPRARTVIDAVYENPTCDRLEGQFHYALPPGASPAGFGMFRGGPRNPADGSFRKAEGDAGLLPPLTEGNLDPQRLDEISNAEASHARWLDLMEARCVAPQKARASYEDVVRVRVDPALLEWSGGNTFRGRIYPIEPRALKRVLFSYEETLPRESGALRYRQPLPDRESLGTIGVDLLVHESGGRLARIVAGRDGEIVVRTRPAGSGWHRQHIDLWAASQTSFEAFVETAGPDDVIRGPAPVLQGTCFFARTVLDLPVVRREEPTGRALFLLDTSLSSEGASRELAARMIPAILAGDPTLSEYAVLGFDVAARWLEGPRLRPNTPASRAATKSALDEVFLEGATDLGAAFDEMRRSWAWLGGAGPLTVFLLSDARITWGELEIGALLARHADVLTAPVVSYAFGDLPRDEALLDALAARTKGQVVPVSGPDAIEAAALAHRARGYRLRATRVEGAPVEDLVVAGARSTLYPGQEIRVAGRLSDYRAATLVLEIEDERGVTARRIPLERGGGGLAPRAWAELWTAQVLAREDERLAPLVTAVSQAFQLSNREASLLILESEAQYQRFDIKKERSSLDGLEARAAAAPAVEDSLLKEVPESIRDFVKALLAADGGRKAPAPAALATRPASTAVRLPDSVPAPADRMTADPAYFLQESERRNAVGDPEGALRALSCLVEREPSDAEALRTVAWSCLAWGRPADAASLLARVRRARGFEIQPWIEEAWALEAAGRLGAAAARYEHALAARFTSPLPSERFAAARHYARLLRAIANGAGNAGEAAGAGSRLAEVEKTWPGAVSAGAAAQLTLAWNRDGLDVDLHVVEPEGSLVNYSAKTSPHGGRLFHDVTTGYGPEVYQREGEARGTLRVLARYFAKSSHRLGAPATLLLIVDAAPFGDGALGRRQFLTASVRQVRQEVELADLKL